MKLKNILFGLVAIVLSFFAVTAKAETTAPSYYELDGSRDYDGRKAARVEETQVDVDGYRADHRGISNFTNVDGGYANNWKELFDKNRILIDDEVFEFRRKILEGKKIYGT